MAQPPARSTAVEPPTGSPWDEPLDGAALAFIDLEMTGLERERDRVVEICVERVRGDVVEACVTSCVRPDGDVSGAGDKIHGISREELAAAPPFSALAGDVLRVLEGAVLVAHAAEHDVAFLREELRRAGVCWQCEHFLDTLDLSRRASNFKSHRLVSLAKELGIDSTRAHRAESDVRVLRSVFAHIVRELRPSTPRDLWHVRTGAAHVRPEILAAVETALAARAPANVRYRSSGRAARDLVFHVTALRRDVDPPIAIGYLDHSRGRRELRLDRILSFELLVRG